MSQEILLMTENILDWVVMFCFIGISISLTLLVYRILVGPTNADRAVALDAIGINLMAVAAFVSISLVTTQLNDAILLIAILSFLGTVAIAKYLEKGVIIDRDLD